MDKKIFTAFRELIYATSGIHLNEKKEALVSARIAKRIRALKLNDHKDYLHYVQSDQTGKEIIQLLDVISTNVTHFFREAHHFNLVSELMTKYLAEGQRRFRFWSAGCSSGEEPYSLAITLKEIVGRQSLDMRILATDISTQILSRCEKAEYEKSKIENVPVMLRDRYFEVKQYDNKKFYYVKNEIKNMILFRRLNLSQVPFPMKGPMDIIFCRNVMIYFDNEVRKRLLMEFYRLLKPKGYLMVGHAESLTGLLSGFKAMRPSVYQKN